MFRCCLRSSGTISSTFYIPPDNEIERVGTSGVLNAWKLYIQKTSVKAVKMVVHHLFGKLKISLLSFGKTGSFGPVVAIILGYFKKFPYFIV